MSGKKYYFDHFIHSPNICWVLILRAGDRVVYKIVNIPAIVGRLSQWGRGRQADKQINTYFRCQVLWRKSKGTDRMERGAVLSLVVREGLSDKVTSEQKHEAKRIQASTCLGCGRRASVPSRGNSRCEGPGWVLSWKMWVKQGDQDGGSGRVYRKRKQMVQGGSQGSYQVQAL